jgi:hypothetical protein
MAKIKLNLARLSVADKTAKTRQFVKALTGNPDFPTPTPSLASITTAADDLEKAAAATQAARQDAKTKTTDQNDKESVVDRLLTQLAAYVESVAGDNQRMIQSAGMDTKAQAVTATEPPSAPSGLAATSGDHDGEIDLSWDTTIGAKSYLIEKSADPPTPTSWEHAAVSTKSKATIGGLPSGARCWFRVAALGTGGQSGWSEPATKIAP